MSSERTVHRQVYRQIPTMTCRSGCTDCCGPAPVSPWEAERLGIPGEVLTPVKPGTMICGFFRDGGCSVYEQRPFICRFFGTSTLQRCPHGFHPAPGRQLSLRAALAIWQRYDEVCPPGWNEKRQAALLDTVRDNGVQDQLDEVLDHQNRMRELRVANGLDPVHRAEGGVPERVESVHGVRCDALP